jgi:hypothetical protein
MMLGYYDDCRGVFQSLVSIACDTTHGFTILDRLHIRFTQLPVFSHGRTSLVGFELHMITKTTGGALSEALGKVFGKWMFHVFFNHLLTSWSFE